MEKFDEDNDNESWENARGPQITNEMGLIVGIIQIEIIRTDNIVA